ncbi:MAG: permease-like cell division protein FtsX [Thermodesulfobacteriota bacterium]|nr:permease-like cell division protein FtsX [Thermodesulfobacteriota bacterium]
MRFRLCCYFIKQALINVISNRVVHVICLGTMVISMLMLAAFLLLFVNLNSWLQECGHSLSISVYLQDGISKNTTNRIASAIKDLPAVEIKSFVSKDSALKDLKRFLGAQAGLIEGLSNNPLPASFELVFRDVEGQHSDLQEIKGDLEKIEGVDEVQYSKERLKQFEGLSSIVRTFGLVVGGLLCTGVLFIVTNTIKLTIYSRRHEIEILKLVGATDWFVKIPFLLEGAIQGVSSGALALLILFFAYSLLCAEKLHFFTIAVLEFTFLPQEYIFMIFFLSVALGLLGSFIATGRFISISRFFDL